MKSHHSLFILLISCCIGFQAESQSLVACYETNPIDKTRKWGFSDRFFSSVTIKCQYDTAMSFTEGLGRVRVAGKYGFVDKTGKLVIPARYELADAFSEGFSLVMLGGKTFFIDKKGVDVFKKTFKWAVPFREGVALVANEEGKAGFIDAKGNMAVPFAYKRGFPFNKGLAPVLLEDGKTWKAINPRGETVFSFPDKVKNILGGFSDGLAPVYVEGPSGYDVHYDFVNEKGEFICDAPYKVANAFKNGRAIIAYENKNRGSSLQFLKYGLITKTGREIVKAQYACLEESPIPGIYYYGRTSESISNCTGYGLLDSMGKELTQPVYKSFTRLNDTTFLCKEAGKYESLNNYLLLTVKGKELPGFKQKSREYAIAGSDTLLTLWTEASTGFVMSLYNTQKGSIWENSVDGFYVLSRQKIILVLDDDYPGGAIVTASGKPVEENVQTRTLHRTGVDIETVPFILLKKKGETGFRLFNVNTLKYMPVNYDFGQGRYDYGHKYSEGMLAVKQKDKWGFIDSTGKLRILPLYERVGEFCNGWAVVAKPGKDAFADVTMVYINKTGAEMPGIKADYLEASDFKEGIAFYQKPDASNDKAIYYINTSGKVIFKTESTDYRKQGGFSNGMAAVCNKDGQYGYINTKGELVIPYQYTIPDKKEYAFYLDFDKEGYAFVEKDGKQMVIDKTGKQVK